LRDEVGFLLWSALIDASADATGFVMWRNAAMVHPPAPCADGWGRITGDPYVMVDGLRPFVNVTKEKHVVVVDNTFYARHRRVTSSDKIPTQLSPSELCFVVSN
jgi:hypothetical protein